MGEDAEEDGEREERKQGRTRRGEAFPADDEHAVVVSEVSKSSRQCSLTYLLTYLLSK